ncbi:1-aminocyclopropane-1-carboxylate deaminase/D-cysteine desulfhydrase [Kitasatospora kifunensis]|uniref:D-cysteine desulfhydrase n=1 Tax=Kitasatospora kifunensis TaxID=58351 RepID=A0A7W7R8S8_KITKI|nr:pyridoxal-phosphate dependent enzyme [Kitasatospora kifunensis]MBB4926906.1 D-cysteine desulfhydrase [Kitasatospora kifunensis]
MSRLTELPRIGLTAAPTPLQPAPRLSRKLGAEIWFKRDDLTGTGLGGNKVRALEYLVADALARGSDCLVTGAGTQSNWAMLAALAARRCGLDPYLVYYGSPCEPTGNHALAELIGADIRFTGSAQRVSVDTTIDELADQLATAGRRPYRLPRGGATALGACGYVRASLELAAQLLAADLSPEMVWLATGSCGTQAGLLAGARLLGTPYRVTGVTVSRPAAECAERVAALTTQVTEVLAIPPTAADSGDVVIVDGYGGPGYGLPSGAGDDAARLVARTEGIFLDPVFGAKSMAALIDAARQGRIAGPVVFLVSGGAPTLVSMSGRQS